MFVWPYSPLRLARKALGLLQINPHHHPETSKVLVACDTNSHKIKNTTVSDTYIIAGMVVYQHTHVPHTSNVFVYVSVCGCVSHVCVSLCSGTRKYNRRELLGASLGKCGRAPTGLILGISSTACGGMNLIESIHSKHAFNSTLG